MSPKNRWTMFGVLPAMLVLAGAAEVEAAQFHFLGAAVGHGTLLRVSGISADGKTAVGSFDFDNYMSQFTRARLWGADGEHLWDGDFDGLTWGVSADGSVLVGRTGGNGYGFRNVSTVLRHLRDEISVVRVLCLWCFV